MVPTMFRQVLGLPDDERAQFVAPALRTVLHGGEPCPPDLKRRMIDWWGPIFTEYFGFSEGGVTFATTEEWLAKPGTVGKPPAEREVLISGEDGTALPPGQEGTVYFRFIDGTRFTYHDDPEKTAKAYRSDGFFTAGDIGWLDDDGYLYISGRQAEVIVCAGVNVYPAEVEAVVDSVEGVADVAVAGGPDPERGEQVVVFVVPAAAADHDKVVAAVDAACVEQLAGYKRPRRVIVRDELPRDPTGKLLRRRLRDELWEKEAGTGFAVSG
jgi:acyl-CoA synthetase (AMP-forming)/AMP-acid ligase II